MHVCLCVGEGGGVGVCVEARVSQAHSRWSVSPVCQQGQMDYYFTIAWTPKHIHTVSLEQE